MTKTLFAEKGVLSSNIQNIFFICMLGMSIV